VFILIFLFFSLPGTTLENKTCSQVDLGKGGAHADTKKVGGGSHLDIFGDQTLPKNKKILKGRGGGGFWRDLIEKTFQKIL